jgi:hypothetical protein
MRNNDEFAAGPRALRVTAEVLGPQALAGGHQISQHERTARR